MKYAVIQNVNGSFSISSESDDFNKALTNFYNQCAALSNADDVNTATITIADSNMQYKKHEYINHSESSDNK